MPKWKKFTITYSRGEVDFLEPPAASVDKSSLPVEIRKTLTTNGRYEVERVARGGISVALKPYSERHTPAEYADGAAVLCARLCKLLGYSAKKPETIHVTIRKLAGPKKQNKK
jgi:hypothetical protein